MAFGDFDFLCQKAALPLCSLVGPYGSTSSNNGLFTVGVMTECYSRNIDLANTVIFEIGSAFIHIAAIGILLIIIFNIKSKYTAVGRTEISDFFYLFIIETMLSLVIDSGVIPPGTVAYPYFVAVQAGVTSALCWCLMINGFLGFQLYEDGTWTSVWGLRFSSLLAFALTFVISLFTFEGWFPSVFSPIKTIGLFIVLYILNAFFIAVYVISQLVLVIFILHDLWGVGAMFLGAFFFITGQVLLYVFSTDICVNVQHYIDGVFFATLTNFFAAMMIYKYWDMITREDLEFSVSNKESAWEVKELMDDDRRYDNGSEYANSTYGLRSHPF